MATWGGDSSACYRPVEGYRPEEVANLQLWVAEAHRDADEAEKAFEARSVRSWRDDEGASKVRKEQD